MKTLMVLLAIMLVGGNTRAEVPNSIDPFYFMVGTLTRAAFLPTSGPDEPPPTKIHFYSVDERLAGLFLEAAQQWTGRKTIMHYRKDARLVVADREVAAKLDEFFRHRNVGEIPWLGQREQLSYLAGF